MRNRRIMLLMFALVGWSIVSASAQESITLRLRPQAGLVCSIESKELTLVQNNGFEVSLNNEIKTTVAFKDVTETQTEIEAQIASLKSNTSAILGIGAKYDSDYPKGNTPDLAKQYDPLIKKPFDVTYDDKGKAIKGIPKAYDDLLSKVFMLVFIQFPEDEVSVGSRWSFDTSKISWTYTITSISKKKVEVSFVGIAKADNTSGVIEGTANIHPTMGVITKSSSKLTISMTDTAGNKSNAVMTTTINVKEG